MSIEEHTRIAVGSVHHPPDDPYPRLLITRSWPAGVARGAVDQWERDLAPSDALLESYRGGRTSWTDFTEAYREEMRERPALLQWALRMALGTGVTLLCGEHPEDGCHRGLLEEMLRSLAEAQ